MSLDKAKIFYAKLSLSIEEQQYMSKMSHFIGKGEGISGVVCSLNSSVLILQKTFHRHVHRKPQKSEINKQSRQTHSMELCLQQQ